MKEIYRAVLSDSRRKSLRAHHYSLLSMRSGCLAVMETYKGTITIFDSRMRISSSVGFREKEDVGNPALKMVHTFAQTAEEVFVVHDPCAAELVKVDLAKGRVSSTSVPMSVDAIAAIDTEGLLLFGHHGKDLIHRVGATGRILESGGRLAAVIPPGRHSFVRGQLVAVNGASACVILDQELGIVELWQINPLKRRRSLRVKAGIKWRFGQATSNTVQGQPILELSGSTLPAGAVSVAASRDGFLILSGSGQHYMTMDRTFSKSRYFELPKLPKSEIGDYPVHIAELPEGIAVGMDGGAAFFIRGNEVKEVTREAYLSAIDCQFAVLAGLEFGPDSGYVMAEDDFLRNMGLWESVRGQHEYVVTLARSGSVKAVRYEPKSVIAKEEPGTAEVVRIEKALKTARFLTRSDWGGEMELRVRISGDRFADYLAEDDGVHLSLK